jgi:hypothetical protein
MRDNETKSPVQRFPTVKFRRVRIRMTMMATFEVASEAEAEKVQKLIEQTLLSLGSVGAKLDVSYDTSDV